MSTPSQPGLARRRATGIRRPRVAGRPAAAVVNAAAERPLPPPEVPAAEEAGAAVEPPTPPRPVPVPVLAAALVLLVGAAVFFGVANAQLRGTPAAQNTALVDIGATAQVIQQVDDALKTIYSFDYTRLDQNETAARAVITPSFAGQFDELFTQVRQLAP
jgi:Mce-associated membrane protein